MIPGTARASAGASLDTADRDARREERHVIFRVSALIAERTRGFCIARNISTGGMMISTTLPLAVGDVVAVELAVGGSAEGKVQWCQGKLTGIRFLTPVVLSTMLSRPGTGSGRGVRRMPRLVVEGAAAIWIGGTRMSARTCDISTSGVRLACEAPVRPGLVKIELIGLSKREATILWSDSRQLGCVFRDALPLADLSEWIDRHHPGAVQGVRSA